MVYLLITDILTWPHISCFARERKRERESERGDRERQRETEREGGRERERGRESQTNRQTKTVLEEGEFSTVGNVSFYLNCGIFLSSC